MTQARDHDFKMDGRGMPWTAADVLELRRLWKVHGGGFRKIAQEMGRTRGSIDGKSRVLGLQFHGGRARELQPDDAAAVSGRTTFPSRVVAPDSNVLKSGDNQRKLGRTITKGSWKGMPLFSLTLEERATCPRSCSQWLSCYGLGMGHAKRYEHGPQLERSIAIELAFLQRRHPSGFVVRLHILGDFYSIAYVEFWRRQLAEFPALHIFGYTARQEGTPIGDAVSHLRREYWARFALRTSGASTGPRTLVIDSEATAPADTIICPAQLGKTRNCGSCGLCWSSAAKDKAIAFVGH